MSGAAEPLHSPTAVDAPEAATPQQATSSDHLSRPALLITAPGPPLPQMQDGSNSVPTTSTTSPVSPSHLRMRRFKPVKRENDVTVLPILPKDLANVLKHEPFTIVIDVRPFTMYAYTHVREALSICIPSTLLKRHTFGFDRIMDFVAPQDADKLRRLSHASRIVLYDQSTTVYSNDGAIARTAAKLLGADGTLTSRLYYLVGGLAGTAHDAPEILVAGDELDLSTIDGDEASKNEVLPMSSGIGTGERPRLTLSSVRATPRSPFSLVPVVTSVTNTLGSPLLTPLRSAHSPVLDESSRLSVDEYLADHISELPGWLADALCRSEQQNVLAEAFHRLQAAEKQRRALGSSVSEGISVASTPTTLSAPVPPLRGGGRGTNAASPRSPTMRSPVSVTSSSSANGISSAGTSPVSAVNGKVVTRADFELVSGDDPSKNRYTDIMPYRHNVVRVHGVEYLNASYIRSHLAPFRYIATQAPTPASFSEFWWCVWEHRAPVIVMLTALQTETGHVKGHKYWYDCVYEGGLHVKLLEEKQEHIGNSGDTLIARKLLLSLSDNTLEVTQLHYTNWPDMDCPPDPGDVLDLVERKSAILRDTPGADASSYVVVHCSAGCGRTGTFCTIDTVTEFLRRIDTEDARRDVTDRVYSVVSEFREQRLLMVQTQRQLLLCYQSVILWYLRNRLGH